jgi:transmembrane sensor
MSLPNKVPPKVREEAAAWFIALSEKELDSSGQQSFDRWLRASPEHVRAFLRVSAIWDGAGSFKEHQPTRSAPRVLATWQKIAACFVLAFLAAAGAWWYLSPQTSTYETRAGEMRTVRLPDGSTVQINARSRIQSTFTAHERAVDLIAGEALFSVATDATRPFSVRSNSARVNAVGTQFDVYQKDSGTVVTVVQGAVSIRNSGSDVLVSGGEQAVAAAGAPTHVHPANVAAAIAWTEGQLVFDSTSLKEVAAEFNRVGLRRLVLEDSSILNLHMSGSFPAHDPSSLIAFLRARLGVTVEETKQEVRVRRAAKN